MDENFQKLLTIGLRHISLRPRSVMEMGNFLRPKLQKMNIKDENLIERVIGRLQELGYLDDRKFVEYWVNARRGRKPKGERVIKWELKEHGVSEELINTYLATEDDENSEENLAKRAGEKKMRLWGKLPKLAQKKKLADYLLRQGFGSSTVWSVIDEIIGKSYN